VWKKENKKQILLGSKKIWNQLKLFILLSPRKGKGKKKGGETPSGILSLFPRKVDLGRSFACGNEEEGEAGNFKARGQKSRFRLLVVRRRKKKKKDVTEQDFGGFANLGSIRRERGGRRPTGGEPTTYHLTHKRVRKGEDG